MPETAVIYEAFVITAINPDGKAQGVTSEGKVREFALVVHRNLETGELSLDAARHFHGDCSVAAFPGSRPWTEEERGEG
jgi:hypothetical protein